MKLVRDLIYGYSLWMFVLCFLVHKYWKWLCLLFRVPVLFSVNAFCPQFSLVFNHVKTEIVTLFSSSLTFAFSWSFICSLTHIPTWALLLASVWSVWWCGVFYCLVSPKMEFAFLISHSPCGFQVIFKKMRGYSDFKPPSLNWKFKLGIVKAGGLYDNVL